MVKKRKIIKENYLILISSMLLLTAALFLLQIQGDKHESYKCIDCNLLIISATNIRPDHLGAYGYDKKTSPNIDNFAADSLVFEDVYSQSSWTLPSATSILTSLYPYEHKLMSRLNEEKLSSDIVTLPDVLRSYGYKTAIFSGGFDYSQKYGVLTRFDTVFVAPQNKFQVFGYGTFNLTVPEAIKWLIKNKDNKFFLYIQGFDAHCPFNPPKQFDEFTSEYDGLVDRNKCYVTFNETKPVEINGTKYYLVNTTSLYNGSIIYETASIDEQDVKYLVDSYDGEIKFADATIDKIFRAVEELGISNKTIIVIVSEHGDMFGKHGRLMRGGITRGTFYDDVLHIPLIIKNPNLESKRVNGFVQLIDVMPTLLDFLNIKTDAELSGKSLVPLIIDDVQVNDRVYAGVLFKPTQENIFFKQSTRLDSVRDENWKLIREIVFSDHPSMSYELYNLREDPEELNNVYEENRIAFNQLNSKLLEWFEQMDVDPYGIS